MGLLPGEKAHIRAPCLSRVVAGAMIIDWTNVDTGGKSNLGGKSNPSRFTKQLRQRTQKRVAGKKVREADEIRRRAIVVSDWNTYVQRFGSGRDDTDDNFLGSVRSFALRKLRENPSMSKAELVARIKANFIDPVPDQPRRRKNRALLKERFLESLEADTVISDDAITLHSDVVDEQTPPLAAFPAEFRIHPGDKQKPAVYARKKRYQDAYKSLGLQFSSIGTPYKRTARGLVRDPRGLAGVRQQIGSIIAEAAERQNRIVVEREVCLSTCSGRG